MKSSLPNAIAYFSVYFMGLFCATIQTNILDKLQADFRFQPFPYSQTLSSTDVNDITQDRLGFIWIATTDGLNRYDGQSIKIYRPSNNNDSLSHFNITCLLVDKKGVLWIGTKSGLNRYDSVYDSFSRVDNSNGSKSGLHNAAIQNIFQDSAQRIWVATDDKGVYLLSSDRKSSVSVTLDKSVPISVPIYSRDFIESKNGNILVASNIGMLAFNEKSKQLYILKKKKTDNNHYKNILRLYTTDEFGILVGATKGLFLFEPSSNDFKPILPEIFHSKTITEISRFEKSRLLIGTRKSGLYLIDLKSQSYEHFLNSNNKNALIDGQINSIFHSENITWIGTNLGISLIDSRQQKFHHTQVKKTLNSCLSGNTIYTILQDSNHLLWVASFGQGVHRINLKTSQCDKFVNVNSSNNDNLLKYVSALYEDDFGNVWIGTYERGIIQFLRDEDKFEVFDLSKFTEKSFLLKDITSINGGQKGKVWFTTQTGGVFMFDKENNSLSRHPLRLESSPKTEVLSTNDFEIDIFNNHWIASAEQGLWKLNSATKKFEQFDLNQYVKKSIPLSLMSLDLDRENNLWVGTRGYGVFRLNINTNAIDSYTIENGLQSNVVMKSLQDSQGDMWFMTDKGLSKLSSTTNKIQTFLEKDGLQADAFTPAGFFNTKTETMWTGGINGFNYFKPKTIQPDNNNKKPLITEFELFYEPVAISTETSFSPLKKSVFLTDKLDLNYNQNVFSFGFSSLEFISPEMINYRFMLDGYDSTWNNVSSERRHANYTNIPPGHYVFRVKSSDKFGDWNEKETNIKISISFPWWQTNFAYITYVFLTLATLYLLITFRTKNLVKRSRELEKSVIARTKELITEKQNLHLEKEKVEHLLSRKNEEFANISHEFRTPLTLILGPLAQLLKTKNKREETDRLNIIQRNGYRLLRMVDQLLNLETFRVKSITQKTPQAVGKIIRLIAEAFGDLAQDKRIELVIKEIIDVNFEFTPDALEKIVLNLLSNAIKYTKPGGTIVIETTRTKDSSLKIQIKDNGIGIPADQINSIFDRYNRVLDENSEQVTGAGIGLALVKSLVASHQGRIEVESKLEKGTTFDVYLPIINEVDDVSVNLHREDEIIAMELMSLTNQSPIEPEQTTENGQKIGSQLPTVLVIEDNKDMREYIVNSIKSEYQVLTAKDGEDGLNMAISEIPDLIISDIMMPKMDGYETTHQLRKNKLTNHIPIVLLTARGDRESRLKGWYEKADEYLTKPFDTEELKIRLKSLLEIRNILKRRFSENIFSVNVETDKVGSKSNSDLDNNRSKQQEIFIAKLNTALEKCYTEVDLSMAAFASGLAVSERQLFRKLKSILDMTPAEYLRRFRLEKAKLILDEGQGVSFAAFEVGFGTHGHFAKCFKAQYGLLPKDYKKSINN